MKLRALVIDDSHLARMKVIHALSQTDLAEFEFVQAADGDEGWAHFDPKRTDIVFVDWNMPKVSGIEFVRKVRAAERTGRVPIVMVTSEKSMGRIQDALDDAGADAYITKPFTTEELERNLSKLTAEIAEKEQDKLRGGFFSRLRGGS
jgi:two-component system chemotaxis response regulator CheY